jgi:hypothetical protein
VGLYIQMPDFTRFQLPADPKVPTDAQVSECWQILRGLESMPGVNGFNFILHARFAIPKRWKDAGVTFTVSDISVRGTNQFQKIRFGAQITQTFRIGLRGLKVPTQLPAEQAQSCQAPTPHALPAPQQLQDLALANNNSTSTAVPKVEQGSTTANIVLFALFAKQGATVTFPGGGITATVTAFHKFPTSPGQPPAQALTLSITVAQSAALGDHSLLLTNPGGVHGPAAPAMLTVVAAGTLPKAAPAPHAALAAAEVVAAPPAFDQVDLKKLAYKKHRF